MKTLALNRIETSIFTEYIRNFIIESLSEFYNKCSGDIALACSSLKPCQSSGRNADHMAEALLVQPFKAFIDGLAGEINAKIAGYFGLAPCEVNAPPVDCRLYDYRPNCKSAAERGRTIALSDLVAKLMDKTLDFALTDRLQLPAHYKKTIASLSIGGLFMSSLGLDGHTLRGMRIRELCRVLKGIGKNFCTRTGKYMINHYTALIGQIAEEGQETSYFDQAADEQAI